MIHYINELDDWKWGINFYHNKPDRPKWFVIGFITKTHKWYYRYRSFAPNVFYHNRAKNFFAKYESPNNDATS